VSGTQSVAWNLVRPPEPTLVRADQRQVGGLPWERMSWLVFMPSASVGGILTVDGRVYRSFPPLRSTRASPP